MGNKSPTPAVPSKFLATYLPGEAAEELSQAARNYYALLCVGTRREATQGREYEAALTNIREGLACSQLAPVQQALIKLLLNSQE